MFKLAERRGDRDGPYRGPEGLYLGPSPLIARVDGAYRVRAENEIAALVGAAYVEAETARLLPALGLIAAALRYGEMARAMIAAVHLKLPEIPEDGIARIARADELLKYNFDPNEPRDWHGRWTDEGGGSGASSDGGSGSSGGSGSGGSSGDEGGGVGGGDAGGAGGAAGDGTLPSGAGGSDTAGNGSSGPQVATIGRVWESYPNSEFRARLAEAEQTVDRPNFGYTEVNSQSGALRRYQMRPNALRAAGMIDANGKWMGKYGVYSRADFLANPGAQEEALTDFLNDLERQLRVNGASEFVGSTIGGLQAQIPVTRANLLAVAHREGAQATRRYLDKIAANGFSSRGLRLTPENLAVETRLRTFADARYE